MIKRRYIYEIINDNREKRCVQDFISDNLFNELVNGSYDICYITLVKRFFKDEYKEITRQYYVTSEHTENEIDKLVHMLMDEVYYFNHCELTLDYRNYICISN